MKTFQQLQIDIQENVASMALKGARNILPAAAAALGAAGTIFQARQSKPQMSPDYGQSGETAKPRTPNVQRPSGKGSAARTQSQVARDDRREEARRRAEEKAKEKIDNLIGSDEERAAAAKARASQAQIQKDLRRKATRDRMAQAADKLGLPEQMTAPKLMTRGLDLRTTKEKQREIKIEADLLPYNPAIGDRYKTQ